MATRKQATLTDEQKKLVMDAAIEECVSLLLDDYCDPFKDRQLPELPEKLYDAADDYFFACVKQLAMELRLKKSTSP